MEKRFRGLRPYNRRNLYLVRWRASHLLGRDHPELVTLDLKNKKVAIFGLGDQTNYPDNFADGVGILADAFTSCGATLVGETSSDDYFFNASKALKNGKLLGLVLDLENQPDQTDKRIERWVKQLKEAFG